MRGAHIRPIAIAAGGTGGHIFPAAALAAELADRGHRIVLLTDARSSALNSETFHGRETYVIKGSGIAGRGPVRALQSAAALSLGTLQARTLLARLNPAALVGFGGYPSVAPILAARTLRRRPAILLHEQNAVLGRANRALARFAAHLALGMDGTTRLPATTPATVVGNPVRPAILALSGQPYAPPEDGAPIRLLVTGGSLGARILSEALPPAIARLPTALIGRLRIVQQCRPEDLPRVQAAYAALAIEAELAPFFDDMPARLHAAHFVVARAGASTTAELAAIGRPALLIPLPHAIDDHQSANARAIGADAIPQDRLPTLLAPTLAEALPNPALLARKAAAIAAHARPRAAAHLADLVEHHVQAAITSESTAP